VREKGLKIPLLKIFMNFGVKKGSIREVSVQDHFRNIKVISQNFIKEFRFKCLMEGKQQGKTSQSNIPL
jgi:hypothetical protein